MEGAAGTNELGSVRTVPPPAGAAAAAPPGSGATARAICDRSQLQLGRQQRLQGTEGGPLAWFAIQEVIDHQVVWAVWTDGRLSCDRLLGARARLLVDLRHRVLQRRSATPLPGQPAGPAGGGAADPDPGL